MNLNSSPSPFHMQQIKLDNNQQHYQPFVPNPSPSSSLSCHIFFGSTQDQTGFYDHHQFYRAQDQTRFYDHHQFYRAQHNSDDNYGDHQGGSTYEMKNKAESGLKLSLWKKEDDGHNKNNKTVKWMSSKMRLMQKMKNPDRTTGATLEDQKLQPSSSDTSSNSSSYNNGSPIRVCADCNTTKTPLWRSGPKGPKSLCNACGIRQRKARRAVAAAAAAANGTKYQQPPAVKIKVQHKEKTGKNGIHQKKRCKTGVAATSTVGSPSNGQKKIGFEDFFINISKNLAFHKIFPEDEKDAAILLMALSSGMVNG